METFSKTKHLVKSIDNNITVEFFNSVQRQGIYPLLGMVPQGQNHNHFNEILLNEVINKEESAEGTEDAEGVENVRGERINDVEIIGAEGKF